MSTSFALVFLIRFSAKTVISNIDFLFAVIDIQEIVSDI